MLSDGLVTFVFVRIGLVVSGGKTPPLHLPIIQCVVCSLPMKQLTCRKCEGHGLIAVLKGHAPKCPYNECPCQTCTSVMQLRASALVRRFRHRAPQHKAALLKTIRSKNGNMRLRILPKNGRSSPGGTEVVYHRNSSSPFSSSSSSSSFDSSPSLSPVHFSSVSPNPPMTLLSLFLQQSAFSLTPPLQQAALFSSATEDLQSFVLSRLSPLLSY